MSDKEDKIIGCCRHNKQLLCAYGYTFLKFKTGKNLFPVKGLFQGNLPLWLHTKKGLEYCSLSKKIFDHGNIAVTRIFEVINRCRIACSYATSHDYCMIGDNCNIVTTWPTCHRNDPN